MAIHWLKKCYGRTAWGFPALIKSGLSRAKQRIRDLGIVALDNDKAAEADDLAED